MQKVEELLERIRELEARNSELQDKLDLIYSIVAPDDDETPEDLVKINGVN